MLGDDGAYLIWWVEREGGWVGRVEHDPSIVPEGSGPVIFQSAPSDITAVNGRAECARTASDQLAHYGSAKVVGSIGARGADRAAPLGPRLQNFENVLSR